MVAVGTRLDGTWAERMGIGPVRAADGEVLIVAAVDPRATYAAFERAPDDGVRVEVVVDGVATVLDPLPLTPTRIGAAQTELILVSAPAQASVQLRVRDASRTAALDLRIGQPTGDGNGYLQRQSKANWSGELPAILGSSRGGLPLTFTVGNTFPDVMASAPATLATYNPTDGWAQPGRAFLSMPAPFLWTGSVEAIGIRLQYDDAATLTFRTPDGQEIRARSAARTIDLDYSSPNLPSMPVIFDVPADLTAGTVGFEWGAARLIDKSRFGRTSWSQRPAPFILPLQFS